MSAPAARAGPGLLVALVLVSVNLRVAITSVPPLIDEISSELALSGAAAGLLTTLPVLCMGMLAPAADRLIRWIGDSAAVEVALVLLGTGLATRSALESIGALYIGTLIAGSGIAIVGVVLPGVVKARFPDRAGAMTGLYVVSMGSGAALAAAVSAPLAEAVGSWRVSLAVWAVLAAVALIVWRSVKKRWSTEPAAVGAHASAAAGPTVWRSGTAWLIASYLAAQSVTFYGTVTWLAPAYTARGHSPAAAGGLLSLVMGAQLVAALVVPVLADRSFDRRPWYAAMFGFSALGLGWTIVAPDELPWLMAVVLGTGLGAGFALGLVLLVDHAHTPAASGQLTAMSFLISYGAAALAPVLLGVLRDVTDGYVIPFAVLLAAMVAALSIVRSFTPDRRASGV